MPVQNKIVTLFQMTENDMTAIMQKYDPSLTPVKLREDINRLNNENGVLKLQIKALTDTVSSLRKAIQIQIDEKAKENAAFISRIEALERKIIIPEKETQTAQAENDVLESRLLMLKKENEMIQAENDELKNRLLMLEKEKEMAQAENTQPNSAPPDEFDSIYDDEVPEASGQDISVQDSIISGNSFSFENGTLTIFSCEGFKVEKMKQIEPSLESVGRKTQIKTLYAQTKKIVIRNGISIGRLLLHNFNKVTDIILPDTIEEIGDSAFAFCESLEHINLPRGLKSIREDAFVGCNNIKSITIPYTVKLIEKGAFGWWKSDQTIYIKKSRLAASSWSISWKSNCDAKIVWNA